MPQTWEEEHVARGHDAVREGWREDRAHENAPPGWGIIDFAADPAGHTETIRRLTQGITKGGRFRILERLELPPFYHVPAGTPTTREVFLDVETTGLQEDASIIQLAMVPYDFASDGRIFTVHPGRS